MFQTLRRVSVASTVSMAIAGAGPLGSAFTYQGKLEQSGLPASGTYDLRFRIFDASSGGVAIATDCVDGVTPVDGVFTVELDFGSSPFVGDARWMEIAVRSDATPGNCGGGAAYAVLTGRQALTVAPYALFALDSPDTPTFWAANGTAISNTNTGFVGIGTTAPATKLQILGGSDASPSGGGYVTLGADNGANVALDNNEIMARNNGVAANLFLNHNGGDLLIGAGGGVGNVGIGKDTPSAKLDVLAADDGNASTPVIAIAAKTNDPQGYAGSFAGNQFLGGGRALLVWGESHLIGPVGIGTQTVPTGVRLAVDGKVLCEEVEVQLSEDWPDYVFADEYALMSLDQVDAYVREHKHLPGVPSAAKVKTQGVNVGAMQATLLRKVEEMTLHMIELDRRVSRLSDENEALRRNLAGEGR